MRSGEADLGPAVAARWPAPERRAVLANSGGGIQLDADNNNGITNLRMSSYPYDFNQGLVTGFNDIAAVPEPATWAMMMGGFALIGFSMRRRRTEVSFA